MAAFGLENMSNKGESRNPKDPSENGYHSIKIGGIYLDIYCGWLAVILSGAFIIYVAAITPQSFGFYHDDSIYVATAKSLATGQGYRIISLPGEPVQTKSPPLQPFLLSMIWRFYPDFPDNIAVMMLLSAVVSILALCLVWFYFTKHEYGSKWQVIIIITMTSLNWRTVILSSGIYVEMFYLAISIAGLYMTEEYLRKRKSIVFSLLLGLIIGLSFLTRTAGITVLVAVIIYSLLQRRFRIMLVPLSVALLLVLAWIGWGYFNRPSSVGVNSSYAESYFQTLAGITNETQSYTNQGKATVLLTIIGRNVLTFLVTVPLICLGLPFGWPQNYSGALYFVILAIIFATLLIVILNFIRQISLRLRLAHIYILLFIALHLVWPYSGYDRFMMPLLPFLILFLVLEMSVLARFLRREKDIGSGYLGLFAIPVMLLVITLTFCFTAFNYGSGVYRSLNTLKNKNINRAAEDSEAIQWIIENTNSDDVLVCYRDPMYFLYTGRKATRSSPLKDGGKTVGNQVDIESRASVIFRIIEENKAKYLILTSSDLELEAQADPYQKAYKEVLEKNPKIFDPVFRSTDSGCVIYRIHADS